MEEVCFLVMKSHPSFQFSLSFLSMDENRISRLPVLLPCFPWLLAGLPCQLGVCVWIMSTCGYMHMSTSAYEAWKRLVYPLKLGFRRL